MIWETIWHQSPLKHWVMTLLDLAHIYPEDTLAMKHSFKPMTNTHRTYWIFFFLSLDPQTETTWSIIVPVEEKAMVNYSHASRRKAKLTNRNGYAHIASELETDPPVKVFIQKWATRLTYSKCSVASPGEKTIWRQEIWFTDAPTALVDVVYEPDQNQNSICPR